MPPSIFQSTTVPLLEQVLNFTQARHGVLAGNVANLDTPGYQVRDLSPELFQEQLREAVDRRDNPSGFRSPGEEAYDSLREVKDSLKSIMYHDESNVSLEHQVTEMSKNQMQHNLALTIMVNQFSLLKAAISEQVT